MVGGDECALMPSAIICICRIATATGAPDGLRPSLSRPETWRPNATLARVSSDSDAARPRERPGDQPRRRRSLPRGSGALRAEARSAGVARREGAAVVVAEGVGEAGQGLSEREGRDPIEERPALLEALPPRRR